MHKIILVLLAFVFVAPAHGMVYSWNDSAGVTHYTNKEYDIPARYRVKAKARYPEQGDSGAPLQTAPAQPAPVTIEAQPQKPIQQVKPEQPTKAAPPTVEPDQRQYKKEREARRKKRNREEAAEE